MAEKESKDLEYENSLLNSKTSGLIIDNSVLQRENRQMKADKRSTFNRLSLLVLVVIFMVWMLNLIAFRNASAFILSEETLKLLNLAFNAGVTLSIAFLFGMLGAFSRLMLSDVPAKKAVASIGASGLMAMFSWIGIKSQILLMIAAPHLEAQGVAKGAALKLGDDFYLMALVAVIVGMFSSNVFVFIENRVKQLTIERVKEKEVR
ncbi:hypothetical protein [Vibrio syngnathi]|uniref:Uncharacterized protein n=1 Tax=Vibrio syngnathi TaxID=3034029 RepID=A0AA34TTW3_9VIBR|nr:hypothetical protein [Vibrio syngnathi]ARP40660.1 hypothetical protein K08M4_39990 [Vibrio syngnathi]